VPEDQGDGLSLWSFDGDHHGSIRGKSVSLESSSSGLRCRHLQDVVIPHGAALKVPAGVNGRVLLAVGDIAIEEGLGGCCVRETARNDDDDAPLRAGRQNRCWRAPASKPRSGPVITCQGRGSE